MTTPSAGHSLLELRVDIDERFSNSPVMDRVSGDIYQLNKMPTPGKSTRIWKVYNESWVIEHPAVEYTRDGLEITGQARFYKNIHPVTTVQIRVTWPPSRPAGPAEVTLLEHGGVTTSFSCSKRADHFRELTLEIAVCKSIGTHALIPSYDTHSVAGRPPDLSQRVLTIEEAYREAGVALTILPMHTVVDDAIGGRTKLSWTDSELHDTMLAYYKDAEASWPRWGMWGFMASAYTQPAVGGIMFDAARLRGARNDGEPDRRAFAVFRNHTWFKDVDNVGSNVPSVRTAALEAQRKLLYTWVHEAGHAFNFLHSWDKNWPDALSWMNYDWRYDQRQGGGSFWQNFRFQFDDEELIHLRHGDRSAVIMGGDPWGAGGHTEALPGAEYLEAPPGAMSLVEGDPPLEVNLRAKPFFDFMEPVLIEVRVRNLLEMPVRIDPRFNPEHGGLTYFIRRPDGRIVQYAPILCKLADEASVELDRLSSHETVVGKDRFSQEVFLSYGQYGFYFDHPGEYQLRAVYQGLGDVLIPSNILRIRVGHPYDRGIETKAQDYFTPDVGMLLYLYGSRSVELNSEWEFLRGLADEFKDSMLGVRLATTLANSLSEPFYHVNFGEKEKVAKKGEEWFEASMGRTAEPNPELALQITDPALAVFRKIEEPTANRLNLAYRELVNRRVECLRLADRSAEAKKELTALHNDLKQRGVNPPVLQDILNDAKRK